MFANVVGFLAENLVLVLVLLAVLALLAILTVVLVLRRSARKAKQAAAPPPDAPLEVDVTEAGPAASLSWRELSRSIRRGAKAYRSQVAGSRDTTLAPWFLAVGAEGGGKSTLLAGLDGLREMDADTLPPSVACNFRFFDNAVVLDVSGALVLGADGARPGNTAWLWMLSALHRVRPAMAADGLIVVLPTTDLVDGQGMPRADLNQTARILSEKLWQAQKVLGLCLPIYVIVTKCDLVPSFPTFTKMLPSAMRNSILGWSNPHPLDMAYRSEWLDQAFTGIRADLLRTEIELFANDPNPEEADELFGFPVQFERLKEPLRIQLDAIFRRTAFQDAMFLRGVYFTGAVRPTATALDGWTAPPVPALALAYDSQPWAPVPPAAVISQTGMPSLPTSDAVVAFSRDLFASKIFPERNLARPSARYRFERDRIELAWQIATGTVAALAVVLLFLGASQIASLRDGFIPALRRIPEQVRSVSALRESPQAVEDLQRSYSRLDEDWAGPAWPASWFSGLDQKVVTALSVGYHRVVVQQVRSVLVQRAINLGGMSGDGALLAEATPLGRLREYLGRAVLVERYVGVFNEIAGTADLNGLPESVKYALNVDLSPEFMRRAGNLGFTQAPSNRALNGASLDSVLQPIALAEYRPAATARLDTLLTEFIASMGPATGNLNRLRDAGLAIDAAARQEPNALQPAALIGIRDNLQAVSSGFSTTDKLLLRQGIDLGPDLQPLLQLVGSSALFGAEARDRLTAQLRNAVRDQSAEYQPINTAIGSLATVDMEKNVVALTPQASSLLGNLQTLLSRGFMARPEREAGAVTVRAGPFQWNVAQLEAASDMTGDFALFRTRDVRNFPTSLQPAILFAAQARLRDNLIGRVMAAQSNSAVGPSGLRPQVRSLVGAAPLLANIARALAEAGSPQDGAALNDAVSRYAQSLLGQVDAELEDGQFFAIPRGRVALWTDGRLDIATLFGQPSLGALGDALQDQRQQLGALALDMAQPLLAIIAARPMAGSRPALVDKWTRLMAELGRAADGRPDTAANRLTSFIRADLPDLELGNCRPVLAKATSAAGNDWFSTRFVTIARQIATSCDGILSQQAVEGYNQITASFNRLLAGRYPFAPPDARLDRPASVPALAEFFRVFDEQAPSILAAYQAHGNLDEGARKVVQFMAQMARVRAFLAPLIPGPDNAAPALKLDAVFRANAAAEQGAREVIDWQFAAGLDRSTVYVPKTLAWRPGDAVEVRLRWAKDGFVKPAGIKPPGTVDDASRSVSVVYDGPWALLALLQNQAAGQGTAGALLRFDVMVDGTLPDGVLQTKKPDPVAVSTSRSYSQAELYIDVGVSAGPRTGPDGKPALEGRLKIPSFPARAPELSAPVAPRNTRSAVDRQR